jgi:hypothetical protein
MKTIAFLSTDEVNQSMMEELTGACGARMVPRQPRDPSPDGQFDAVLYDLDHLPAAERQQGLAELLAGRGPRGRVAVHSFNLEAGQVKALRRRGVGVFRRLDAEVIRWLLDRRQ